MLWEMVQRFIIFTEEEEEMQWCGSLVKCFLMETWERTGEFYLQ